MKLKKILLVPLLIIINMPLAHASIIDNDTYTTDTETGLDWLDVNSSLGRSHDDVSSQFGIGGDFEGFRYATGEEFNGLIGHYLNITVTGYGDANHGEEAELFRLVRLLCAASACLTEEPDISGGAGALISRFEIYGLLGDQDSSGDFWVSSILGEIRDSVTFPEENFTDAHRFTVSGNKTDSLYGSFLVRTTVVPIPTSAYLILSALFGLFAVFCRTAN